MNAIQQTLSELHTVSGIKAVSVVTLDGLVAADAVDPRLRGDVIGGLASYLLMATNKSLQDGGLSDCAQLVVHATHGRVILTALEDAYLVVVFDQFADIKAVRENIADAAQRIRASSRMD